VLMIESSDFTTLKAGKLIFFCWKKLFDKTFLATLLSYIIQNAFILFIKIHILP